MELRSRGRGHAALDSVWFVTGGRDDSVVGIGAVVVYLITSGWSALLAVVAVAEAERISRSAAFQCLITLGVTTLLLGLVLGRALGV